MHQPSSIAALERTRVETQHPLTGEGCYGALHRKDPARLWLSRFPRRDTRRARAQRGRRERHQVLARVRLFLVGRVAPSNNSGSKPTCRGCSGVDPYGRKPVPVHHTQTLVGGGVFVSMTGLSPRSKGEEIRDGNRRERYRANRVIANEARWRLRAGWRRDRTRYGVCGVACGLLLGTDLAGRRLVLGPATKG